MYYRVTAQLIKKYKKEADALIVFTWLDACSAAPSPLTMHKVLLSICAFLLPPSISSLKSGYYLK